MQIGFLGLGQMGAAIAMNLVRARHDVAVWNRTAAKARAFAEVGRHVCGNAAGRLHRQGNCLHHAERR